MTAIIWTEWAVNSADGQPLLVDGSFRDGNDSIGAGPAVDSSATAEREPGSLTAFLGQDCLSDGFCLDGVLVERLLWW